ncbi:MAG: DUF1858 domain-containing protein [Acidobacteriota bacterium]
MSLPITPETKIGAMLDAYPELEDRLIAWVPEFKKLKNPVLRRTIAKVATLEQAAKVAGISVRGLVGMLREAAGQEPAREGPDRDDAGSPAEEPPLWLDHQKVTRTIDADAIIAAGQHPLGDVRRALTVLAPGHILRLRSGFRPVPLIESLAREGFDTFSIREPGGEFSTYIRKSDG